MEMTQKRWNVNSHWPSQTIEKVKKICLLYKKERQLRLFLLLIAQLRHL